MTEVTAGASGTTVPEQRADRRAAAPNVDSSNVDSRDDGRAAVVTLFDSQEQAVACHDKAVALLHEGLPRVTVTRVVQGRGEVFVLG